MKNGDLLCFEYHYLYMRFTFFDFSVTEVYKMNDFFKSDFINSKTKIKFLRKKLKYQTSRDNLKISVSKILNHMTKAQVYSYHWIYSTDSITIYNI